MHRFSSLPAVRGFVAFVVVFAVIAGSIADLAVPARIQRAVAQDGSGGPDTTLPEGPIPTGDVIVLLDDGARETGEVRAAAAEDGIEPTVVFSNVVDGYAATITEEEAAELASNPDVLAVYPDNPVYQAAQTVPAGIRRIGADTNDVANINGLDQRVDADVAVLDSGVDPNTGDLNVAGGYDCASAGTYMDQSGHGTHVAGTIAALDNNIGVVGVAPGARIWSVRVLNGSGVGSDSTLICGLDWVYANRATIDVVNMSVVGSGADDPCVRGAGTPLSPLHEAVCKVYDAGIPIVAAAGNAKKDASNVTPATFDEVIAVSAFADYDGRPGGTGTKPSTCGQSTLDDRFFSSGASGSNFGPDVDIMAPGVCVLSTAMGGGTAVRTGTSMATPHVTGAIALYVSQNRGASVETVKNWLYGLAVPQSAPGGIVGGDPDSYPEPVLKVSLGDIPLATLTPTPTATGTVDAPSNAYKLVKSSASSGASNRVRDLNLATRWETRSDYPADAYVWVELPASSPIGSIRWVMGQTGYADRYWIETSNDMVSWKRIAKRGNKAAGVWNEVAVTGTTARYVRFRFDNPYGDVKLGGIAEIQVWAPGAPPLNATATPTATPPPVKYAITSTKQTLNSKNGIKVLDGDAGTYWITNPSTTVPSSATLQLSLGTTKYVGVVRWMFGLEGTADVVRIETSTNETTWTLVATRTNAPLYEWQEFAINRDAKFVRFRLENPNNDNPIGGLAEVEVWSGPGAPLTSVTVPATATPTATASPTATTTQTATTGPSETPTETATTAGTTEAGELPTETATPTATTAPTETASPTATEAPATSFKLVRSSASSSRSNYVRDLNPETVWKTNTSSPPADAYVWVQLPDLVSVGAIRWMMGETGIADRYWIETSTDLVTWTRIAKRGNKAVGVWNEFVIASPVEARYVRFRFANPYGDAQLGGIAEIEVWPPSAPTLPASAQDATEPTESAPAATPGAQSTPTGTATEADPVEASPAASETAAPTAEATPEPTIAPSETPIPTEFPTETPTATPTDTPAEPVVTEQPAVDGAAAPDEAEPYTPRRARGSPNADGVANLFDDDAATYWATDISRVPDDAWVIIDLGAVKWVGAIEWVFTHGDMADDYVIEVSTNRHDWVTVYQGGYPEFGVWEDVQVGFETRYVQITVSNPNGLPQIGGLAEVIVWP